ncbi:MAG: phosphoribosylglycinamide formyltransferase [Calditrichales bacterium]|nr:MAG: phosphoribosylglycinamide formyltransferase [Calditrichales bacterium]
MKKKRLAVLASGRGSNFLAILEKIKTGEIPAEVGICITNSRDAGVIDVSKKQGIPISVVLPKNYPDAGSFNDAVLSLLINHEIDYVILAGYLKLLGPQIVNHFSNRILNIHPALLPSFGGKGMYGHHVHDAVYKRGVKVSGATVHLVNTEFDAGPIVLQKAVSIESAASAEEIAKRVLEVEHEIYPRAVKLLVEEHLVVEKLRVSIIEDVSIGKN